MRKIAKYIPVFFLWLAGVATMAHLIIPHDHHLAESIVNQEESCPFSKSKTGHHSGFPVHCHAFNEFASERLTTYILKKVIPYNDLSFSSFYGCDVLALQQPLVSVLEIRDSFPDPFLLEISQLRAPPSLS